MRGRKHTIFLSLLCLVLLPGCYEAKEKSDTGITLDTLARDGPRVEGLKPDGPEVDLGTDGPPKDVLKPDMDKSVVKPDGPPTCPASKMVWGQFTWGGDCVWQ